MDDKSHLPLPECIEVAAFREEFKERALSEATPIGKIHDIVLYLNYADQSFIDAISNKNESSFNLITLFIVDIATRRHFLPSTFALSTSHSVDIFTVDHSLCRHFVRRRKNLSTINFSTKICRHYVLDIFLSTFGYFPVHCCHPRSTINGSQRLCARIFKYRTTTIASSPKYRSVENT